MTKILVTLLLVVHLAACGRQQSGADAGFEGALGQVRDQHFAVELVGATIAAFDGDQLVGSTTTNAEGQWELPLRPGSYSIRATYTYSPQGSQRCQVRAARTIVIEAGSSSAVELDVDSSSCFPATSASL